MSTGISVRDRLLAGVAFNLAGGRQMMQQQQYPQMETAPHNRYQMYGPVASLQQSIDEAFRVPPRIHEALADAPDAETTITLREDVEADLLEMDMAQRREILSEHFCRRLDEREDTSRRLQAIMRMANDNPFAPDVENPVEEGQSEALRLFLRSACRQYGYRKLELDVCGFMNIYVLDQVNGQPLGSVPPEPTVDPADNSRLTSEGGSLTLFEADVPDQFGQTTTWMWWKICKPLASYEPSDHHHPAPDVEVLEESWTLDAIPGVRTTGDYIMQCATMPTHLRSEDKAVTQRRKGVAYRYSRDGVPGLAMSKKTGELKDLWWGFRDSEVDVVSWELRQREMSINACLMHGLSAVDAEWVHVPPEVSEEQQQQGEPRKRPAKRASGERKPSGLRNEVREEDC
ncbi:hypothetical protein J3F83DRAFT_765094 [Trichoderma novae-zelandiae]